MRKPQRHFPAESAELPRHEIVDVDSSAPLLEFAAEPASASDSRVVDHAMEPEAVPVYVPALPPARPTHRDQFAALALFAVVAAAFGSGVYLYKGSGEAQPKQNERARAESAGQSEQVATSSEPR